MLKPLPHKQLLFNTPQLCLLVPLGQKGALSIQVTAPVSLAQRLPSVRKNVQLPLVNLKLKGPGILPPACSVKGPIALPSAKLTKPVIKGKPAYKHSVVVSPVSPLSIQSTNATFGKVASDAADATSSQYAHELSINHLHLHQFMLIPCLLKAIQAILLITPLTARPLFFPLHHLQDTIRILTHQYHIWARPQVILKRSLHT